MNPILSAFIVVFIAELADKTQLAVLSLSLKTGIFRVLVGSSLAFIAASGLGVAAGYCMQVCLPFKVVSIGSALLFIVAGIIGVLRGEFKTGEDSILKVFMVVFLAELGDKTNISIIALTGLTGKPIGTYIGALAGIMTVCLLTALLGRKISAKIPAERVSKASSTLFIITGMAILVSLLF